MKTIPCLALLLGLLFLAAQAYGANHELVSEQARERAGALRSEIARHDDLYFRKASPEITDAEYDALKRELASIGERFPGLVSETGLGDDRTAGFVSHRHRVGMLGLNKSHTEAGLTAFITKLNRQLGRQDLVFVIEPKYDGLAISVTYENGSLVRALTRGNGVEGDDVTANLLALSDLPRELRKSDERLPEIIELRGEVYLTHAEFERINRERSAAGEEPFAHPRNLAAGTLKQNSDPGVRTDRRLAVTFFGVGAVQPGEVFPSTQQTLHAQIRAWGLPGVSEYLIAVGAAEVAKAVRDFERRREVLPYPVDGVVVKLDDQRLHKELGASGGAPRGAIAHKFGPDRVSTRITAITLQVGRTGVLSPVAELEPVRIGGSVVRRASLHNRQEIARKDIRIGDHVFIEKAGAIIPVVTGVDRDRRVAGTPAYFFPDICPTCDTRLSEEGAVVRCPNQDCIAQVQRRLEHFVSDAAADIDGLGKTIIETLVARGWVATPADLYALAREQLVEVTNEKAAVRILAAIETSRRRELWRLIHGFGVPEIGAAASKSIAGHFGDLSTWANAREQDYQGSGIRESVVRASLTFFAREQNRRDVEALRRATALNDPDP